MSLNMQFHSRLKPFCSHILKCVLVIVVFSIGFNFAYAQQLAFPGAEGYGKYSKGGRGGKVYEVTTLADDGPGSFRQAFNAYPGQPLTIVFRVGGIIDLLTPIKIQRSNMTLAGQTAPGDGICTKRGMVKIYGANLIIRYMHFRPGDVSKTNNPAVYGLDIENSNNFIVDHCSMSWSMEEAATFYDNKYSTVQWCIISESLNASYNGKGSHGYAGVWGGQFASYHHNLLAHHHSREIRFNGSRTHDTLAYVDYRNNVVYNWGNDLGCYGNEIEIADTGKPIFALRRAEVNIVNNYYKPGPATPTNKGKILINASDAYQAAWATRLTGKVYLDGNYVYGVPTVTANNFLGLHLQYYPVSYIDSFKLTAPTQNEPIVMQTALDAYKSVLAGAGDTYPKRDTIDKRMVNETITGTATQHATNATSTYYGKGNLGMIDTQDSAGGWPAYDTTAAAPMDTDHDGMPDSWELAKGLNPNDSTDGNTVAASGYTMLEEYLNNLVNPATLPLRLLSFTAIANAQAIDLNWATADEINTSVFLVEKSTDGNSFTTIGSVAAAGATSGQRQYAFHDTHLSASNALCFYRLKMEDKDGSFTYSNVLAVKARQVSNLKITVNPVHNTLYISHEASGKNASVVLFTIDSKVVLQHASAENATGEAINVANLSSGTYLLAFFNNGHKATSSFIKK
ncbi:T9SS type A sorting domain-containing protein [Parasediminibacterium sp. JCM 36343]|uniref:T9SS type A sorting domain-containing protein n=1 Tax=Parasediminibacterium sp. JCM 36343 TaxID=3374279 RepID=UPI00397B21F7